MSDMQIWILMSERELHLNSDVWQVVLSSDVWQGVTFLPALDDILGGGGQLVGVAKRE